jgi:hypothetical protein
VACVMLLIQRHNDKIKKGRQMRNSSARKRRVAQGCSEKPMATGTGADWDTSSLQKIICRKAPRANWILVGYHGETIVFVEIRTHTVREDISGLPELSVSYAKQSLLVRTAQRFSSEPLLTRLSDAL